jgi:hypothetical protein
MSRLWCWLGNSTSQLQALGSIGAVFVAVALGCVAVRHRPRADAQADAATAQVDAGKSPDGIKYSHRGQTDFSPHLKCTCS